MKTNQGSLHLFTCCSLYTGRPRPRCSRSRQRGASARARSAATAHALGCKCGTSARRTSSRTQSAGKSSSTPPRTFPAACTCASAATPLLPPHNPSTETKIIPMIGSSTITKIQKLSKANSKIKVCPLVMKKVYTIISIFLVAVSFLRSLKSSK